MFGLDLIYKIELKLLLLIKGRLTRPLLRMGSPKVLYLDLYFFFCTPAERNLTFIRLPTTLIFCTSIKILSPLKMP